ncbi:hypothetical protein [Caldisericum exile]|uniref:DUF5671 domain-containing protein n=1 Tax=Caldisericum exile (strain DSM 21853 / NBRC 104410 / AZM16c01) TaxID=511051 RepID=A0A7U6GFB5_CALEA|nr:hypothetical protein [Caldisericum exile]BAL81368.1 hypothetical protein CSE_12420 [Caldisericum exile AZM16c01]
MKNKVDIVRSIYLFYVSLTGVIFLIVGLIKTTNALTSIYYPGTEIWYNKYFYFKDLYEGIVMTFLGLIIFLFHWYFIVKEKRLGKISDIQYESSMNFFEAIFFYLLCYVGITIFIISSINLVSGFYNINYPPPVIDESGKIIKESTPYVTKDIGKIIRSIISMIIGFITFLIGFIRVQLSMKKIEKQEINT